MQKVETKSNLNLFRLQNRKVNSKVFYKLGSQYGHLTKEKFINNIYRYNMFSELRRIKK